ncbi:hypothetical protein XF35_21910 [Streptomyces platensis subsp. clarensis]|nr:hypothetical protein [Streptomyces platensis subsp. clarensis]
MTAGSSSVRNCSGGLPVSPTSAATRASACSSTASAIRSSARCRSAGVVSDQRARAVSAAVQAASVSDGPERGALRCTSPVAGLTRSVVAPEAAGRSVPAR